ncbi:MAG: hypothetical protein HY814_11235 [Candidatus Riflebacteria bacterium]|nr:hypothetical protein [Candidatus Riflebacteria bacterium]
MFRPETYPKRSLTCPHCTRVFKVPVVHPLRTHLEVLLCDRCGEPTVLEFYDEILVWLLKRPAACATLGLEDALLPCHCGGTARLLAAPRCPDCHKPLDTVSPKKRRELPIPLIGEIRLSPAVWDRQNEALHEELRRSAIYCLDPSGARFGEGCLALPALALLDPERAFGLFRKALEANPAQLVEEAYYPDQQDHSLFTLGVALLTAAINGGGRRVLSYVAGHLAAQDDRWIAFVLEAMHESDQLNRMGKTTWLEGGSSRSAVETLLRAR